MMPGGSPPRARRGAESNPQLVKPTGRRGRDAATPDDIPTAEARSRSLTHGMFSVMVSNLAIHASAAIAPAVAMSVLLRRVGFEEFGAVLAAQALVALFVGLSDLGCSLLGLQRTAKRHHSSTAASTARVITMFARMRFSSALVFGGALIAYLMVLWRGDQHLVAPALLLFFTQALTPTWALLALEGTRRNAPWVVGSRFVWVVLAIAVVREGAVYLWLVVVVNAAILVFTQRSVCRALGENVSFRKGLGLRRFLKTARATAGFSASRVAVTIYQTAPLLVMSHVAPSIATGMYATIETVHKLFVTATYPITDALLGRTARTASVTPFLRYGLPLLSLFLVGAALTALYPELVLLVVGGGRAMEAAPLLRWMMAASAVAVAAVFIGYPLAGALGSMKATNRTTFAGPVVLGAVLIVGIGGGMDPLRVAVAAVFAAEGVVLLFRIAVARRVLSGRLAHPNEMPGPPLRTQ